MLSRIKRRIPSPAFVVSLIALVLAMGSGAYAATGLIHGDQLANNTITHNKLSQNTVWHSNLGARSVTCGNLIRDIQRELVPCGGKSNTVPGLPGVQGPKGATGATGATGAQGVPGAPGQDATTQVTAFSDSGWFAVAGTDGGDTAGGHASITSNGVALGGTGAGGTFADGSEYAGIATHQFDGVTAANLARLDYTAGYTQSGTDQHGAIPYLKVKLQPSGGACGDDDVVFSPNTQNPNLDFSGSTGHFRMLDSTSLVRADDDAGSIEPAGNPFQQEIHNAGSPADHVVANEPVCEVEIIAGDGGAYTSGATANVQSFTIEGNGITQRTFLFGS